MDCSAAAAKAALARLCRTLSRMNDPLASPAQPGQAISLRRFQLTRLRAAMAKLSPHPIPSAMRRRGVLDEIGSEAGQASGLGSTTSRCSTESRLGQVTLPWHPRQGTTVSLSLQLPAASPAAGRCRFLSAGYHQPSAISRLLAAGPHGTPPSPNQSETSGPRSADPRLISAPNRFHHQPRGTTTHATTNSPDE